MFMKNCLKCKIVQHWTKEVKRGIRGRKSVISSIEKEVNEIDSKNTTLTNSKRKNSKHLNKSKSEFKVESVSQIVQDSTNPNAKSALRVVQELRSKKNNPGDAESILTSSKFEKFQIINFERKSDVEVARILRKHVIYCNDHLVVLNKPYGLPVHGGDKITQSIRSSLSYLSKMIYGPNTSIPLTLCNRLDKMTTGIIICSPNPQLSQRVIKAFREQRVLKKYWAVVLGTPDPMEGVLDIPIMNKYVSGEDAFKPHSRTTLRPYHRQDEKTGEIVKTSYGGLPATTWYRTLDKNGKVSMVELQPLTSQKHQIRVHLAEGLNCAILGDHKYSHSSQLLPQKLPNRICSAYRMTSSQMRSLPLHLQLREIIIPNVFDREHKNHLHVVSRYSPHFYMALKRLGLRPGKPTEWHRFKEARWSPSSKTIDNPLYIDPTAKIEVTDKQDWESLAKTSFEIFKPQISKATFQKY